MGGSNGVVLAAVITAIFSGVIGVVTALPTVVKTIREIKRGDTEDYREAVTLRALIRRLYSWMNGRAVWDDLPDEIRESIEREALK